LTVVPDDTKMATYVRSPPAQVKIFLKSFLFGWFIVF